MLLRKSSIAVVGLIAVLAGVVGVAALRTGGDSKKVSTDIAAAHAISAAKEIPGFTRVGDQDGNFVGYVATKWIEPTDLETVKSVNARTLIDVTDENGQVVGHWAYGLGFISLTQSSAPGFDVEDLRAQRYGGCEEPIGDLATALRTQKYPRCAVDPSANPDAG